MIKIVDKLKSLYKKGFFHILVGNTLVKMVAFISSIVIVRLVIKEEYAYLAYANNLYSYISLFSGLGMSVALLKFCSSNSDPSMDRAYLKFSLKYGSLFQIALTIILNIYVLIADIPFPNARKLVLLLFFSQVLSYIIETLQCYIRSQQNNKLYAKIGLTQTLCVFVFSVIFVLLIGVNGIPFARYLAALIVLLFALPFVKSNLKDTETVKISKAQAKAFLSMGISLMVANLFSMMMPLNEMFLVNNMIRDEIATANYKVATMIPSQISFITGSIMIYYFPIIARMQKNNQILKTAKNIQLITGAIVGGICIVGYFSTPLIFKIVYGSAYADAISLAKLFWIIYGINAGFRMIPMNIMPALGRVKFNAIMSIGSAIIHIIVDYFLIKLWGIQGAAYAILMVYLISGFIYWGYLIFICRKNNSSANII